jgi:hypothetical protein
MPSTGGTGGEAGGPSSSGGSGGGGATAATSAGGRAGTTGGVAGTGTSGVGGASGVAGRNPVAGNGGASGASGASGGAGTGGASGAAGSASIAECQLAEDCVRVTDCCSCTAEPKNGSRPMCDLACTEDACFRMGIAPEDVSCAFGRCVFDLSCDASEVTCPAATPTCDGGWVPSVRNSCWGPCVAPTECRRVSSCDTCEATDALCVRSDLVVPSVGCVEPRDCQTGSLCECLDACGGLGCSETESGVGCFCLGC